MAWMSPNMKMETTGGGIGKMFGRALSGDTLFQNIYTAERTNGMISIASSFPGSIKAFDITPGNEIILQKSAFLASEAGVELSMHFRKKLGSGLFGGEGFILQKLSGNGITFASMVLVGQPALANESLWWWVSLLPISLPQALISVM